MYNIVIEDESVSFSEILKEHQLYLSSHIINAICEAIEEGKSNVDIAKIITPLHNIYLKCNEKNYLDTLESNKNILIGYEEYELCAKANKGIEAIKNKKNRKLIEGKKA